MLFIISKKKTFSSFIEICKIIVDFRFKLMSRDGVGGGGEKCITSVGEGEG